MSRNARLAAAPRACDGRLVKVLAEQYRLYVSDPNPNMLALMDERDARVWHFLIGGLDGPYTGGEYIFTLTAPDEFPTKPPRLEFKTTNGVYAQGGAICISVGEFHATDKPGKDGSYGWRPALGMGGFAAQVLNGLICFDKSDQGFGLSVQCNDIKAGFARTSRTRNLQAFPEISARFESMLAEDSSGAAARSILEGRRRLAALAAAPAATAAAGYGDSGLAACGSAGLATRLAASNADPAAARGRPKGGAAHSNCGGRTPGAGLGPGEGRTPRTTVHPAAGAGHGNGARGGRQNSRGRRRRREGSRRPSRLGRQGGRGGRGTDGHRHGGDGHGQGQGHRGAGSKR